MKTPQKSLAAVLLLVASMPWFANSALAAPIAAPPSWRDAAVRTSATTSESLGARAPCGDVTRGGGIPGVPIGQYADRHDRHASDSQTLEYRRLEA